ncbi:hypothetical protein E0M25_08960 [Bacillus mycoides]|uniref:hypothetical protein n=1 Tax=Bacillus mycoides TaxID=1405 RepID=UPI0010392324|nr:hypothetical protein [Bacillus mycoides]TBX79342.1 hypothetical protein E0M25_08960 [Bacillus mycoides]
MNTLTFQYDTFHLIHNPDLMQELLKKAFHDEFNTNKFYELLPFPISLNADPTEAYISECLNIMITSPEKGIAFLSLLSTWWKQRFASEFENCMRNISDHGFTLFSKKFGEDVLFVSCLFTGHVHSYTRYKHGSTTRFVPFNALLGLQGLQDKVKNLEDELVLVTNSQSLKRQSLNLERQNQLRELQIEFGTLQEEALTYKSKHTAMEKQLCYYKGKESLLGKRIAIIGVQWPRDVIETCKETYFLKEITTYLATEKLNQLSNLSGFDLIVFSSAQARHSAYYQAKVQNIPFIHSKKTNADMLFVDLCTTLGGENI